MILLQKSIFPISLKFRENINNIKSQESFFLIYGFTFDLLSWMNKKLQFFLQHFLLRYSLQHFCFSRFIIYIPWTLLLYLFISDWYLYLSKHTCVYVYVSHTHVYKCSCWICMHGCIYTQHLPPTSPRPVLCLKFVIYIKILNVWMIKTSFFPPRRNS